MKMIPTKTIFNVTEDQEFVREQWTEQYCDLLPLLICVHKCLYRDFYSVHKAFSLWWKTNYSSLFIFVSKGIHLLYLFAFKMSDILYNMTV